MGIAVQSRLVDGSTRAPIFVCLLGGFRLLKDGAPVHLRPGGKTQALLGNLALRTGLGLSRDELLALLWPTTSTSLSGQSLNTLVYSLQRALGDALAGRALIVHDDGRYRLNVDDGVIVDVSEFDAAVEAGDRHTRAAELTEAAEWYATAADLYTGDLLFDSEIQHVIERERLRSRYLYARARLADHEFAAGQFAAALEHALAVLACDPCREDAHRMAMRTYVRLGERAQAMRQYRLCSSILSREFDAPPEGATTELYELIRLDPERV
jgi:DNA-binding SARP family transcriptional activator